MIRLNLLSCIVTFILLAVSCDNGQLTAECIDDEAMEIGEGVQTNETASAQKKQTKQGSAKVISIPPHRLFHYRHNH
jgi:hypothetical protein